MENFTPVEYTHFKMCFFAILQLSLPVIRIFGRYKCILINLLTPGVTYYLSLQFIKCSPH